MKKFFPFLALLCFGCNSIPTPQEAMNLNKGINERANAHRTRVFEIAEQVVTIDPEAGDNIQEDEHFGAQFATSYRLASMSNPRLYALIDSINRNLRELSICNRIIKSNMQYLSGIQRDSSMLMILNNDPSATAANAFISAQMSVSDSLINDMAMRRADSVMAQLNR